MLKVELHPTMFRGRQFQRRNPMTTLLAQRYQTVSHFSRPIRVSNKPRFPGNIFDFMRPGKPPYSPLPSARCLSLSLTDSHPKALRDSLASRRSKIIYHSPISILPFPTSTTSCLMNWTDLYDSYPMLTNPL